MMISDLSAKTRDDEQIVIISHHFDRHYNPLICLQESMLQGTICSNLHAIYLNLHAPPQSLSMYLCILHFDHSFIQ